MRRAAKVDANHAEIVEALRGIGCSVQSLAQIGSGCPDLLVAFRQRLFLMEVKTRRGKLNADQEKWIGAWRGPVYVVRNVDEAIEMLKAIP